MYEMGLVMKGRATLSFIYAMDVGAKKLPPAKSTMYTKDLVVNKMPLAKLTMYAKGLRSEERASTEFTVYALMQRCCRQQSVPCTDGPWCKESATSKIHYQLCERQRCEENATSEGYHVCDGP